MTAWDEVEAFAGLSPREVAERVVESWEDPRSELEADEVRFWENFELEMALRDVRGDVAWMVYREVLALPAASWEQAEGRLWSRVHFGVEDADSSIASAIARDARTERVADYLAGWAEATFASHPWLAVLVADTVMRNAGLDPERRRADASERANTAIRAGAFWGEVIDDLWTAALAGEVGAAEHVDVMRENGVEEDQISSFRAWIDPPAATSDVRAQTLRTIVEGACRPSDDPRRADIRASLAAEGLRIRTELVDSMFASAEMRRWLREECLRCADLEVRVDADDNVLAVIVLVLDRLASGR